MSYTLVWNHLLLLSTYWDRQILNQLFSSQDEYSFLVCVPNIYRPVQVYISYLGSPYSRLIEIDPIKLQFKSS